MIDRRICVRCVFFTPDKNSCSTRGCCHAFPVSTVDEKGYDIETPYPRRDSEDSACWFFRDSEQK